YKNLEDKFSTSYYELSDCFTNLKKEIDELDFDSSYLDKLNNRLSDLQKLEKKYGMSNNELVAYKEKIKEELGLAINYDNYIKEAYALVDAKYNKLLRIGNTLTKNRKLLADKLCKMIINDANFLNLENISIKMDFLTNQKVEFKDNGIDNVSFLVSFNEGEPLKPFVKVSSGGEKSRIFMILQFIITKLNNQSTLVLDEIDTGVSGRTSGLIAKMMQQNSASIQLIVITHSVIVAGVASNHYKISKIKNGSHITTTIKLLDISQRIIELAYMLSPEEITDSAISQAKTILGIS
ncbi:MAG: hypothetical protein LBV51_00635, partial [Acholeplasmatales bacterium]|nr:hypothetical protein [Acholeplasmatales bacterium]